MPYLSEAPEIFFQRFYTGWVTLRNQLTTPIRLMGRRVIELYDAFLAGNDLEITNRLSLMRRPGYTAYFPGVMNGPLLNPYSWRSASQGIFQVFDTTVDIEYIAPGAASPTVIYTKTGNQIGQKAFFFGVGNYLFVSGLGFAFKWDGGTPQGVTNWGISAGTSTIGPDTAGSGRSISIGGLGTAWSNPGNVSSSVSFASFTGTSSQYLNAYNFAFSVPATSSIAGIEITFNVNPSLAGVTVNAFLSINGVVTGSSRYITLATSGLQSITLGGTTDSWGAALTAAIVNGATFGVNLSVPPYFGGPPTVQINDVQMTVFTGAVPTATPTGSGTFTAQNGYSYVIAYGNSISEEISNGGPISANTGPFTNVAEVQIAVVASADSQVNQIHVYRTTDSGGGSVFYELPNSPFPNTTGNVNDAAPDTSLQVNNLAAINLQNTPPPANLSAMEWFGGRLWGAVNNLLYFSTGADSLSGLEQSNWNPEYVFVLPTNISRLVATPNGMLVHCLDDCYIVRGISTTSFTVNEFMRDLPARFYNAVDSDGSNVYVFTSDRQLLNIAADGMHDIGTSIGDQLTNVDPTQAYLTSYRYGLDSMLFLLDVPNGILYPYNINQMCWCLPAILKFATKPSAAGAIETAPGVWSYIIGTGTSLGQRSLTTFTDLGTGYSPQVVIGTITLADPLTLAKVENTILQLTGAGNSPTTVSVFVNDTGCTLTNMVGNQITGTFSSLINGAASPITEPPTYATQPVGFRNFRYQWMSSSVPEAIQTVQTLIGWGTENAQNELIGFGISGKQPGDTPGASQLPQLQGH